MSGKKLRGKADILADVDDYEMDYEMTDYDLAEIEKLESGLIEDYEDWDYADFEDDFQDAPDMYI